MIFASFLDLLGGLSQQIYVGEALQERPRHHALEGGFVWLPHVDIPRNYVVLTSIAHNKKK